MLLAVLGAGCVGLLVLLAGVVVVVVAVLSLTLAL